jgi:hypothetical protein
LSAAAHAWQGELQSLSQHRPSTQCPDAHSSAAVQAAPFGTSSWHVESELRQNADAAQSLSFAQLEPQSALEPVQRFAPQLGKPGAPAESSVQVPLLLAPRTCAHTSHAPPQLASQQ